MLRDMLNRLLELAPPMLTQHYGATYSDKEIRVIHPPQSEPIRLLTLTGFAQAIRARVDDLDPAKWTILVDAHDRVLLLSRLVGPTSRRPVLLQSNYDDGAGFTFGQFHHREEFVIGLLSKFVPGGDTVQVLQLASSLQAESVTIAEDDGISQKTTVRQGAVLKQRTIVKGRVTLRPYRTFREVEQPASEFVFRLRSQDGEVPTCALFEADGGKWKLDAVLTIKQWLEEQQLGIPVVA